MVAPENDAGEAVCSLPSNQLSDRVAMIRRDILPHATRHYGLADGVAVEPDDARRRRAAPPLRSYRHPIRRH